MHTQNDIHKISTASEPDTVGPSNKFTAPRTKIAPHSVCDDVSYTSYTAWCMWPELDNCRQWRRGPSSTRAFDSWACTTSYSWPLRSKLLDPPNACWWLWTSQNLL